MMGHNSNTQFDPIYPVLLALHHKLGFIVFVRIVVFNSGWIGSENCVTFWYQQRKSGIDALHVSTTSYLCAILPLVITRH